MTGGRNPGSHKMRLGWLAVGCLCSLLAVTKNLLGAERESAMEEGKIYAFTMKTIDGQG